MKNIVHRKSMRHRRLKRIVGFYALTLGASALCISNAYAIDDAALPGGGVVTGGSATINYTVPGKLDIHQNSNRAVIDWDSFNIGKDATTQFYQPSSQSIVVNRVTGAHQDPSQILGTLKANGTVFVLDRNGVIFGEGSRVDVGSIVVSTGGIDKESFMGGTEVLTIDNVQPGSSIVNNGTITVAEAGLAAFVAPSVVNNNVIQANLGRVALASGSKATVDLYGDGLVSLATDMNIDGAAVSNSGKIVAEGGKVLLTAGAAKSLIDNVINMSGEIDVTSVREEGGRIILEGGNINVSGKMHASGKTGGGKIHVGGEYMGGGKTRHAAGTKITNTATIKANATGDNGKGGEIIIWSDQKTEVSGVLEAKGGISGKGGFIETSSKKHLTVEKDISVDASGGGGAGEWLLDPEDIVVTDLGDDGNANTSDVASSTINAALNAGNNVTLTTSGTGPGNGDVTFSNATILKSTTNNSVTLRVNALRDIYLNNSTISSTSGNALNVVLNADYDANNVGAISLLNTNILTNGGYFVAGGGSGTLGGADGIFGNGDGTGADDVMAAGHAGMIRGFSQVNSDITTNAGNVFISGRAHTSTADGYGVHYATGSLVTTTTGNVKITGYGATAAINGDGIRFDGSGSGITSQNGNITLIGTGAGNGSTALDGVLIYNGATVRTTGTGNITMTGTTVASSSSLDYGIRIFQNSSVSATGGGSISFNGSALTNDVDFAIDNASVTTSGGGGNGNVTINADTVTLSSGTINSANTLTFTPRTASTTIGLGGGTGTLNLDDTELNALTARTLIIGNPTAGTGDIDLDSWNFSGKTHHVEIYGNDIDIGGVTLGTGNFLAHALDNAAIDLGTLTLSAAITKSVAGSSTLTLRADKDIVATTAPITASNGSLNVIVNSDRDADGDGAINLTNSNITTNGGYAVFGGGAGNTLGGANGILGDGDGTGVDDIFARGNATYIYGVLFSNSDVTTNNGAVVVRGQGSAAGATNAHGTMLTSGSQIDAGTGVIRVYGNGGNTGTNGKFGIYLNGAGSGLTSSGNIYVLGIGATSGNTNDGLRMNNGANITGTGAGIIDIFVNGGNSTAQINTAGTTNTIGGASMSGSIRIVGDSIALDSATLQTSGTTTLAPRQSNVSLTLGNTATGFSLTDAELQNISTGRLFIGDSTFTTSSGDMIVDSWNLAGTSYDVELYANDITFQDTDATAGVDYALNLGSGNFLAQAQDRGDFGVITVNAPILKAAAGTSVLNLRSDRDIVFNTGAHVTASGTAALNTILNADRNANLDGAIVLSGSNITTNGGYFVAGGGAGTVGGTDGILGNGDGTGADDVFAYGNSTYASAVNLLDASTISTGNGAIFLRGRGYDNAAAASPKGVNIAAGSVVQSTGGNISINGTGGAGSGSGYGIYIGGTNTKISTSTGNISLRAQGGASSVLYNTGLYLHNGAAIESTGAGAITITAIKGAGSSQQDMLIAGTPAASIGGASASGNITFNVDEVSFGVSDIRTSGTISFRPRTASTSIGIGGGAGTLNLGDTLLSYLTGGRLVIGDATNGTGDIDVDTWDLSGKAHAVELYGNDIDLGGLTLGSGDFLAQARDNGGDSGAITISGAIAKTAAGSSLIDLRADHNIDFSSSGTLGVTNGMIDLSVTADENAANGGAILFDIPSIDTNGGDITLSGPISLLRNAEWNAGGGAITTAGALSAAGHNLTMIADTLDIGGSVTGTGTLTLRPYQNNRSVGLGGGTGGFNLSDVELGHIDTGILVIGSSDSAGDVHIQSWDLSSKTHNVQIFGSDMNVAGLTLGTGDVTLYALGGGLQVSANSLSASSGDLNLLSAYDILVDATLRNTGAGSINLFAGWNGTSGITTPALFDVNTIDLGLTARNLTIGANGSISSAGTGTSVLLAANGNFVNNSNAGINAVSAAGGRYLVYSDNPGDTVKGDLDGKSLYNKTYNADPVSTIAATDSRFVYRYQPTMTLTANNVTTSDPAGVTYTYSISGLINDDLLADALSGAPTFSLLGTGATRTIRMGTGSLLSDLGYNLALADGTMTVTSPAPAPSAAPVVPARIVNIINQAKTIVETGSPVAATTSNNNENSEQTLLENSGKVKSGDKPQRGSVSCLVSDIGGGCFVN